MSSTHSHVSIPTDLPGQLVHPQYARPLQQKVKELMGLNHDRFPGAQPVSFERKHIETLQSTNFFVCEKTDGMRAILFLNYNPTQEDNFKYEAFLIDRKNTYRYMNLRFPQPNDPSFSKFHSDTLMDGELVIDVEPNGLTIPKSHILRYLIFDCMVVDGKNLMSRPLTKRLGYFTDFILRPYQQMLKRKPELARLIPFSIELKPMQLSYGMQKVFEEIPHLKHKSDGLIFTSSISGYHAGTDQNILKWKPAEENTVDFKIRVIDNNGQPQYILQLWEGRDIHRDHAELILDDIGRSTLNPYMHGKVIECWYDPQWPNNWRFMRFRDDKDTANHASVFRSIMDSIRDGVSKEELLQKTESIRSHWKEREKQG
ncbi:mRNA capping enzyme, catalytic domain-containing protein [Paraphysoderma sedebokerense]|nr:mRNA capping enzyme, catalytic domain-containing protein [Paraphysoderma sedebokerense]